jgi:sulfur-oxidizing protein SoxX
MKKTVAHLLMLGSLAGTGLTQADSLPEALGSSFEAINHVDMGRLQRDPLQEFCSKPRGQAGDSAMESALRDEAMASVVFPEGDDFIGDWARGAEVANNGRGLQYSDDPEAPNGGNCYACHQLDPAEVAYGNLGPSLMGYGARGQSDVMLRYTWTKLWNTHAYNVCSHMPRFGALGILTEQQLKDLMAYLFDPDSPVNQSIE